MDTNNRFILPVASLSTGNHVFEFNVEDSFFGQFDNSIVLSGDAKVIVRADKGAGGVNLDFYIHGEVEVECDRCLEPVSMPVDYEGRLAVRTGASQDDVERYDGEVMYVLPGEDADLSQYIYESICLSLPITRVHGEDENGDSQCDPDMLERFRLISQEEFDSLARKAESDSEQIAGTMQEQLAKAKQKLEEKK